MSLVVRCTFELAEGRLDSARSLLPIAEHDRVPWKGSAELVVLGSSSAPLPVRVGERLLTTSPTAPRLEPPAVWLQRRLPDGFDYSAFNVAPPTQWFPALGPGTPLQIFGVSTKLPDERPQVFLRPGQGAKPQPVALACDTLEILVDERLVSSVWRAVVSRPRGGSFVVCWAAEELQSPQQARPQLRKPRARATAPTLDVFEAMVKQGANLPFPGATPQESPDMLPERTMAMPETDGALPFGRPAPDVDPVDDTLTDVGDKPSPLNQGLPFSPGTPQQQERALPPHVASALSALGHNAEAGDTLHQIEAVQPPVGVPFGQPLGGAPAPEPAPPPPVTPVPEAPPPERETPAHIPPPPLAARPMATPTYEPLPPTNEEIDLATYAKVRAEIEEAADPVVVLEGRALSKKRWDKLRKLWTRRALADPGVATQIRDQLAEHRARLREGK